MPIPASSLAWPPLQEVSRRAGAGAGPLWSHWVVVRTELVAPLSGEAGEEGAEAARKLAEARRTPRKLAVALRILAGPRRPQPLRSKSSQPQWSPAADPARCSHRCSL